MKLIISLATLLVLAGCSSSGSSTLTRDKAKAVLEKSEAVQKGISTITLDDQDVQAGLKAGLWRQQKPSNFINITGGDPILELTPLGRKYFRQFHPQIEGRIVDLNHPANAKITEITGISNAPLDTDGTMKAVDFVYALAFDGDQQPLASVISATPTKGQTVLKLYDDGWRVPSKQ